MDMANQQIIDKYKEQLADITMLESKELIQALPEEDPYKEILGMLWENTKNVLAELLAEMEQKR